MLLLLIQLTRIWKLDDARRRPYMSFVREAERPHIGQLDDGRRLQRVVWAKSYKYTHIVSSLPLHKHDQFYHANHKTQLVGQLRVHDVYRSIPSDSLRAYDPDVMQYLRPRRRYVNPDGTPTIALQAQV